MINVEIKQGRKYQPMDVSFDTIDEAIANLELEDGQRVRMKDESGKVIRRLDADTLAAEQSAANDEEVSEIQDAKADDEESGQDDEVIAVPDMPKTPNTTLMESPGGIVNLGRMSREKAWETAIDVVHYPVHHVDAYYFMGGYAVRADGVTNTGRESTIRLVVVDRERTGEYSAISAVTGRYATPPTANVYLDLKQYLDADLKSYKLREVYVSGDGGAQQLVIECKSSTLVEEDDLRLMLVVDTSSDGSTAHQITMLVWNKSGGFRIPVPAIQKKLATRHTKNLSERSVQFAPSVSAMVKAWDDEIVPMMAFFADHKLDAKMAHDELDRVAKEAGIGLRHRESLIQEYTNGEINTKPDNTFYSIYSAVSEFTEREAKTREAGDRWRYNLTKAMRKDYNKIKSKKS